MEQLIPANTGIATLREHCESNPLFHGISPSLGNRSKAMIIQEMNDRIRNQSILSTHHGRRSTAGPKLESIAVPWIILIVLFLYIACIKWDTSSNDNGEDCINQQNVIIHLEAQIASCNITKLSFESQFHQCSVVLESTHRDFKQLKKDLAGTLDNLRVCNKREEQTDNLLMELDDKDEDIWKLEQRVRQDIQTISILHTEAKQMKAQLEENIGHESLLKILIGLVVVVMTFLIRVVSCPSNRKLSIYPPPSTDPKPPIDLNSETNLNPENDPNPLTTGNLLNNSNTSTDSKPATHSVPPTHPDSPTLPDHPTNASHLINPSDEEERKSDESLVLFPPNGFLRAREQRQHILHIEHEPVFNKYGFRVKQRPKMWSIKPVEGLERGTIIRVKIKEVLHGELSRIGHFQGAVGYCKESFPDPRLRWFKNNSVYVHANDIDTKCMRCESERCPEHHTLSMMHLDVAIGDVVEGQVWMEWIGQWRYGLYNWTRVKIGDQDLNRVRAKISCPWPECPNYNRWWHTNDFAHVEKQEPEPIPCHSSM